MVDMDVVMTLCPPKCYKDERADVTAAILIYLGASDFILMV